MIFFSYACQKQLFSIFGVAHNDPFFVQIGPNKTINKRFYQPTFFQNYWIATQFINTNWIL